MGEGSNIQQIIWKFAVKRRVKKRRMRIRSQPRDISKRYRRDIFNDT